MYHHLLTAAFGTRLRAWLTIAVWVVLIGVLTSVAPSLDDVKSPGDDGPPPDSTSALATDRLAEAFPARDDVLPGVVAVSTDSAQDTTRATVAVLEDLGRWSDQHVLAPISPLCADPTSGLRPGETCLPGEEDGTVSADGLTRIVVVPVAGDPSSPEFRDAVDALREHVAEAAGSAATTHLTGPAGIVADTVKVFASGDRVLLFGTIALVLVILLLVYRSPLLALLPLLAVGFAMRLAETSGVLLADAGIIDIDAQTASIMTVLLFGVGTDYALIITARYREELRDAGPDGNRYEAMVQAMRRTGEVLISSAGTIVLAMMALLFTASPSLQGFGPYLAIGVLSMALVAATLFPALVVVSGKAVFWPLGRERATARVDSRTWHRVADLVDTRPVVIAVTSLLVLVALSAGMVNYKESFNFLTGFRVDTDSAAGQRLIADDIGPGEIAPTTLLVEGRGLTPGQVAAAADALEQDPAVARAGTGERDLTADGSAARITVVLDRDPYSLEAMESLPEVERTARDALASAGAEGARVTATGETADNVDVRAALDHDIWLLVPLMLLLVGGVLAVLLRSLLAPLYLMAALFGSFIATMGLTVLIAITWQGADGIGNRVTVYVLVFLIALGVDYTIFLVSRLRQELDTGESMRKALTTSLVRTGGVVSSAGVILAATFSVLMTQPIRELYQFGLAMALGLLLDTFVVRPFLVPAVIRLLGDRALWPYRPRTRPVGTPAD